MSFSNMFVETVTSYGRDIDNLIVLIAVIVGFFWVICEGLFFYFIWRFRARPGHESQYVAGTTKEENKWITRTHNVVLLCDVVIVAFAISIWVNVKQTLPDPDNAQLVRVVGQQWAWSFEHESSRTARSTPTQPTTMSGLLASYTWSRTRSTTSSSSPETSTTA